MTFSATRLGSLLLLLAAVPIALPADAEITGRWAQIAPEVAPQDTRLGNGSLLVAAGGDGLFVSDDFGRIWTRSLPRAHLHDAFRGLGSYHVARDADRPKHLWVGIEDGLAGGGLRRSTDGGRTFDAPALADHPVLEIARDPATGVLWAAPAWVGATPFGTVHYDTAGLWRSDDGGASWQRVESFTATGEVARFLDLEAADGHVQAAWRLAGADGDELWISRDDGATWTSRSFQPHESVADVALSRAERTVTALVVAVYQASDQLLISTDGGSTWSDVTPPAAVAADLAHAAFGPTADPTLFLAGRSPEGTVILWRSADLGASWDAALVPGPLGEVAVHGDEVWIGNLRSRDGGRTFDVPTRGAPYIADELIASAFADGALVATGDIGIARSSDAGRSWEVFDARSSWTWSLVPHPSDASRYFAIRGGAVILERIGGSTTQRMPFPTGRGGDRLAVAAARPETIWVVSHVTGALASDDGGATWRVVTVPDSRLADVALDVHGTSVWLLAGDGELFRSDDDGATWSSRGVLPGEPRDLVLGPHDADVVLVATSVGLFRTADGGATWQQPAALRGVAVHAITVDADRPGEVLVATDRGIRRSVTHGRRWHLVSGVWVRGPVGDVAFDPTDRDGLYATGPHGIVRFRRLR